MPHLTTLPGCALLVALHAVLYWALAGKDVPSVVFSPGGTAPLWMLAATVLFAVVRLMVFFWVPAVVSYRVLQRLLRRWPTANPSIKSCNRRNRPST
jgi:hypothetical protein